MPWTIGTFHKEHWYQSALVWIGVAIVASVGFLALPRAQGIYRHWNENRRISRAATAFAGGKYEQAILDAKVALAFNPHCVEATRIIAKSLEALNAPQALLVRRRIDALTSNDVENTLAMAAGSWRAGDAVAADRALNDLPPAGRDSAGYHELAARVAARQRDTAGAIEHWQEAVRLEPTNDTYALELATALLTSTAAGERAAGIEQLDALAARPETRLAALRAMLSDAAARGEVTRSLELSTAVTSDPAALFTDHLRHLAILHTLRDARFDSRLAQLQETAAANPEDLHALLTWMNLHNLALMIPEWAAKLPPEILAQPRISAALAEAEARSSNWAGLKKKLESESWGELEFLRLAHLSRALGRLGDDGAARAAWANAVSGAQGSDRALEILGRTVLDWGWTRKAEEVLWKLASGELCPRWVADYLWASAIKDGDSSRLYEAARVILKADPKSVRARNNFLALALLTGNDSDSPQKMAETLHQQNPTNPFIATTYGLSLCQQGRAEEAVRVMNTFPPKELHQPAIALYHGIFLAGAGRFAEAQDYFAAGARAPMLPEEKALLTRARGAEPGAPIAALDRTRSDTAQLYAESRQAFLAEPKNVTARGNYILLALLSGQSVDSATHLARAQQQQNPENASVAATFSLALYQQGKVEEAAALLDTFSPDQLRAPSVALYAGLILSAAERKDEAAPFLEIAARTPLLPEERTLLARAQAGEPAPGAVTSRAVSTAPAAPLPAVAAIDRTRSNTAQLFQEARDRFVAEPKNVAARRNYLLLALLTGQSVDSARQLARAFHQEQPRDVVAASIHGLSLAQQGKAREAVEIMETFPPEQLREPLVALYYGYFLASYDRAAGAAVFFALAETVPLLPEERALIAAGRSKGPTITIPVP